MFSPMLRQSCVAVAPLLVISTTLGVLRSMIVRLIVGPLDVVGPAEVLPGRLAVELL